MAEWNDFIDLFPNEEQAVIQELKIILNDDLNLSSYADFVEGFDSLEASYFQELSIESNDFILSFSSWLGNIANESEDWEDFRTRFNSKAHPYIDLIIAANEESSPQEFGEQENSERSATISEIEGLWEQYVLMLASYMEEVEEESSQVEITSHPQNVSTCEGNTAVFNVSATGDSLSFQWRRNGNNISGAFSSSLQLINLNNNNQGTYDCVVSSEGNSSIISESANLNVKAKVKFIAQPQGGNVNWGGGKTFSVAATGDGTLSYQWKKNNANISGATSASYTLNNLTLTNSGSYKCVVTNSCGSLTSSSATLTVVENLSIVAQPSNQNQCEGATATFSITAESDNDVSYQWKKAPNTVINGATNRTLSISELAQSNEGNYFCEATIPSGLKKISEQASLAVKAKVKFTSQPQGGSINWGASKTFSVAATGDGTLSYQWKKNNANISGATSASYTLNNLTLTNSGTYKCVVTNSCGSLTSSSVTLTVVENFSIVAQPSNQNQCEGATATFSITAEGEEVSYQWKKAPNTVIAGATNRTLSISGLAQSNEGNYFCEATIPSGLKKVSEQASLAVKAKVKFTAQPQGGSANWGASKTFSVAATGDGTLSYQWKKNNANISGATSASYTLNNLTLTNSGSYKCVVTNSCGSLTSSSATLTVVENLSIVAQPSNQNQCEGATATFSITAEGEEVSYRWKKAPNTVIAGATNRTLSISGLAQSNEGNYFCEATIPSGLKKVSEQASLAVKTKVKFTAQPQGGNVNWGASKTFSVAATGDGTLSYQWKKNNANISGATSASYTLNNLTLTNSGSYKCVVTNSCGSLTSSSATLTVVENLSIVAQPSNQIKWTDATAHFSIEVESGGEEVSYQWKKAPNTVIDGANSNTLTLTNITDVDQNEYFCQATIPSGLTKASETAELIIQDEVVITSHPQYESVNIGENTALIVGAIGAEPLTYQWRKDGGNIVGATAATYTINDASINDDGVYQCVVTNDYGSVASLEADLYIIQEITITSHPISQRVPLGEAVLIEVSANSEETIIYQWRKNGTPIPNSNSPNFTINNLTESDLGSYDCILSIASGFSTLTTLIKITMEEELIINGHPESAEINWNSEYTLTIVVSGAEPITFQWRKDNVPIEGANSPNLTLAEVKGENSGSYDCIVSNAFGEKVSNKAGIEVVSFSGEIGVVSGTVRNSREIPIGGISVKVIDKKPGNTKVIAEVTTNDDGFYRAEYLTSELLDQDGRIANLVVQLFEDGADEPVEVSELIQEASSTEEVDFVTTVFTQSQTEFDLITTYINSKVDTGANLQEFNSEDISLLANAVFSEEKILNYIDATRLNTQISAVTVEQFYGIVRLGLSSSEEALSTSSDAEIKEALLSASGDSIISVLDEAASQVIADAINGEAAEIVLQSDSNPFKNVFDKVSLTEEKKKSLIQEYLNDPTGEKDILTESSLTETEVTNIKRVITLSDLDSTNAAIVDVLDNKVGLSGSPTELTELISFETSDWEALIDDDDDELLSIPPKFEGTTEEKKTAYAKELLNAVESKEPTKVLAHKMKVDPTFESGDFDQFFTDHPDFEFGGEQIAVYLDSNPLNSADYTDTVEAQKSLEGAQRLFNLAPETGKSDVIKPLIKAGVTSSSAIVKMGETDFVATFEGDIGSSTATDLFKDASGMQGQLTDILVAHTNTPSPLILSSSGDSGVSGSVPGIPNLESIFGSLDYCECTHCRSVYSPAAYLVDLLNFIDHNATPNAVDKNNLKEELVRRRGEIEKLFLHCDNTNTPIPYIDIVNEILENYIAGTSYEYQTETDAATLKATPQNSIESVYNDDLKSAIHPVNLPFNLWFEQARMYLKQTNVDLGDFIAAAPMSNLDEPRQAVISAAAALGISAEQLDIITGTSVHTAEELYGVSDIADVINPVSNFIKRAGVSYEELTELMDSKFINPLKKVIYFPADGSCRLDGMTIGDPQTWADPNPVSGFDTVSEILLFNRFVRLQRLTGWSFKDLDLIINSLNYGVLNETTIINIFHASRLKEQFNVSVEEMLTWWNNFDVGTYIDDNLFDKLFQDTSVNPEATIIPEYSQMDDFTGRSFLDEDIKPLVLGALNLSAFDLDVILAESGISDTASVTSFSALYRVASFTKAVGISIQEYYRKSAVIEVTGIMDAAEVRPKDTQDFLDALELMESIPFEEDEITYLKSGDDSNALAPTDDLIIGLLEQIRDDYQNIDSQFSESATGFNAEVIGLTQDFGLDIQTLSDYARGEAMTNSTLESNGIILASEVPAIESEINSILTHSELSASEQQEESEKIITSYLLRYQYLQTDFKTSLAEKLAVFHDLPVDLTAVTYGTNESTSVNQLSSPLLDIEFLLSTGTFTTTDYGAMFRTLKLGAKVACIATVLNTTDQELDYLINKLPASYMALTALPISGDAAVSFDNLKPILSFRNWDKSLFNNEISLIEFLNQQYDLEVEGSLNRANLLAAATEWRESDISVLIGADGFDFEATPEVYQEVEWIKQLAAVIKLMHAAHLDARALVSFQLESPNKATAFALRNFLSSSMNKKQWAKIAPEIHDKVRVQKRDAMVAFLIAEDNDFYDSTDVYDHFLIDTQMSPCQLTSRIKQSVSAIQLFIQRIGLGFEGEILLNADKMEEWNWRKNYRVWEANRKIFLYPENYVLPEVRTNKSKLYTDFEEALTQGEVDTELVESTYQKYLEDFKTIANLEVMQMAQDDEKNELHVIAKTQNDPVKYYHRKLKNRSVWSTWEQIPIDMNDSILPIVHNGSLIICWMDEREKRESPDFSTLKVTPAADGSVTGSAPPVKETEVRLAWTTMFSEGWTAKNLTKEFKTFSVDIVKDVTMVPMKNQFGELYINIVGNSYFFHWGYKYHLGRFKEIEVDLSFTGNETADQAFIDRTVVDTSTQLTLIDSIMSLNDYSNDPYVTTSGLISASPHNTFFYWKRMDKFTRNAINYGGLSAMLGNSVGNALVVDGTGGYLKFKNQKLEIPNLDKFNYPSLISVGLRMREDGTGTANTLLSFNRKLLTQTNGKTFTLIGPVGNYFPLLSHRSVWYNMEDTTPFFLVEKGKTYLVYPEYFETSGSLNATDYNILAIPVDTVNNIYTNL